MTKLLGWFSSLPDLAAGAGLFALALVTRLPFRSLYLHHWDSVNFALSLEVYDVRLHQPHPPGYFLYSLLGQLVNALIKDANASLVWISVISGALGVAAIFWTGRLLFNRQVGLLAALLTLTSPLHWFYSEVALSYSLEFLGVTVIAGLCFRQWNGRTDLWPWTALALGVAGGIRQNDLVFLFLLWAASLQPLNWKQRAASLALLGGVVLAWAIPMTALSGGIPGYLAATSAESAGIAAESSFGSLAQLLVNGGRMTIYLAYGLLLGGLPLLGGALSLLHQIGSLLRQRRTWLFILWIAPAFGFYLIIHIRQHGHIFTFLPALLLLAAFATTRAVKIITQKYSAAFGIMILGLILAANGAFFLFAPPALFGSTQLPLQTPSRQTIQSRDQFLQETLAAIRANFDPASTAVLAGSYNFRHPDYYLRDYQLSGLSHTLGEQMSTLPESIHTLVLFDPQAFAPGTDLTGAQTLVLPDGNLLSYFTWEKNLSVCLSTKGVMIGCRAAP